MTPHRLRRRFSLVAVFALAFTWSCALAPPPDYSAYRAHMPRSILALPPLNQSTQVNAPYVYLSTVTRPLAERGYYVFPVAVIDAFMKDNGLPSADEMHTVSLDKIREIIGADAVLYVTIEEWGQKYQILSSNTVVSASARLVDTATGTELWTGKEAMVQSSGGGNDIIAMLIAALVQQVVASLTDPTYQLSRQATTTMIDDPQRGLLLGPRHPQRDTDARGR